MSEMRQEVRKAFQWLFSNDTGMSSKALLGHMVAGVSDGSYPHDPADLGRCLRLLEKFPQWKERIPEMARYGSVWATYALHWNELRDMMDEEVGIDWSKARKAPKTYEFMSRLQGQARKAA